MTRRARTTGLFFLVLIAAATAARAGHGSPLDEEKLAPVAAVVEEQIHLGNIPGAVVVVGHDGSVVYRRAFGERALEPQTEPMSADTVFDLASLTKAVATTTAVLQLAERGRLKLDAPAARYWRAFAAHGKAAITLRQLLAHTSGLRAGLDPNGGWTGRTRAAALVAAETPLAPPGSGVRYSDLNFVVLGEVVRRVSGLPLDVYCRRHIFGPLGMHDTGFRPAPALLPRIAPTRYADGAPLRGEVQDPLARRMGGVAGHAGLFSTADDLARFAQALLDGGARGGRRILRASNVARMLVPQQPDASADFRALGWRSDPPFAANRDELPPLGTLSHFGYTGTALWIDPVTRTYVVLLTNRVHAVGGGDAEPLRRVIAAVIGAALGPLPPQRLLAQRPEFARYAAARADQRYRGSPRIETGIDVLAAEGFAPLAGLRIGLITNRTGRDASGRRDIDLLRLAPRVSLVALFSPEHGLASDADTEVMSGTDPDSGLPVHSLYGQTRRPTAAMLEGIDALVFDIQDVGTRFYTYVTTMAYAMEAAAAKGIGFYVLDRPNPLGGQAVQGPTLDPELRSFTGYFPLPVRHGMTVGELAQLFNAENRIGARLEVIPMRGYRRGQWYDQTGLAWINPSPNLHSLAAAVLYPGVGLIEGANVSVGRGTETPFQVIGAPWIDAQALAAYLAGRSIAGVYFIPADFTPVDGRFRDRPCHGVRIILADREALDSPALGLELASALYRLYPGDFRVDETLASFGSRQTLDALRAGVDPRTIRAAWQPALEEFRSLRSKYLLYFP